MGDFRDISNLVWFCVLENGINYHIASFISLKLLSPIMCRKRKKVDFYHQLSEEIFIENQMGDFLDTSNLSRC